MKVIFECPTCGAKISIANAEHDASDLETTCEKDGAWMKKTIDEEEGE